MGEVMAMNVATPQHLRAINLLGGVEDEVRLMIAEFEDLFDSCLCYRKLSKKQLSTSLCSKRFSR